MSRSGSKHASVRSERLRMSRMQAINTYSGRGAAECSCDTLCFLAGRMYAAIGAGSTHKRRHTSLARPPSLSSLPTGRSSVALLLPVKLYSSFMVPTTCGSARVRLAVVRRETEAAANSYVMHLALQVVREQEDPLCDPRQQRLLDRPRIHLQVADRSSRGQHLRPLMHHVPAILHSVRFLEACWPGQHLDLLLDAAVLHDLRLKVCQRRVIHLPIVSGCALGRKEALRSQAAAGLTLGDASPMQH